MPNLIQPPNPPVQVPNPMLPQAPPPQVPQLNWSYFKLEFSGKPEEDAEAHLLRTNYCMETHNFPETSKVQRFCLTLTGEARLWYGTLRPIDLDWTGLQEYCRQQYSMFGNTREQLFHVWRSFHYDENVETIDSYMNRIKQIAALLNYGEPHILELFKNTLPCKLYWVLFSINNLRDAVDAVKRVLTKEKIDKQLSGQTGATTPFMKVGNVPHLSKKVSLNAHNPIRKQLESLTSMVYNMSIQKEENNRLFKPQIYQKRGRGQGRQNSSNRNRSFSRDRQRQIFRPNYREQSQNRFIQCGNDSRRGNYRCQNYNNNRSDSRDRGRQNFRRSFNNDNRDRSR